MSNVQVSTLQFTSVNKVDIAHSRNIVSFVTVNDDDKFAFLHTVEGGIVPVKDLNQLVGIEGGDPFQLIDGNIIKVDKKGEEYRQYMSSSLKKMN